MVLNTTHKLQVCWWKGRVTRKRCGRASDGSALLRGLAAEARCEHGAAETLHPCVQLPAVHDACERDAGVWRTQRWTTSWGSQWGQSLRIFGYKSNNTNLQKNSMQKKYYIFIQGWGYSLFQHITLPILLHQMGLLKFVLQPRKKYLYEC